VKVVNDLCENSGPIDAVHGTQLERRIDVWVPEQRFDDVLWPLLASFYHRCELKATWQSIRKAKVSKCRNEVVMSERRTIKGARHSQVVYVTVCDSRHL
jgi:hypothetical protein